MTVVKRGLRDGLLRKPPQARGSGGGVSKGEAVGATPTVGNRAHETLDVVRPSCPCGILTRPSR